MDLNFATFTFFSTVLLISLLLQNVSCCNVMIIQRKNSNSPRYFYFLSPECYTTYLVIIVLSSGKGGEKTHTTNKIPHVSYRLLYLVKAAEIAEDGEIAGADVPRAVGERLLQVLM